jgi:hypothetical protein
VRKKPGESRAPRSFPLRGRIRAAPHLRHFSARTEEAYLGWIRRFFEFHGRRDPSELGGEHVDLEQYRFNRRPEILR